MKVDSPPISFYAAGMTQNQVETQDVVIDGPCGQIFVRGWNVGKKPFEALSETVPLILLHDSLGSVELWRDFPLVLAKRLGRPVLAYDRLGFGKSSARTEPPSLNFIREEAEVYFACLKKKLALKHFALFGHSVGGGMALMIAAANGSCCRAVITESAQAFVEDRTRRGIEAAREGFQQPGQLDRLKRWHGEKAKWVLDAWTETWLSPAFASWRLTPCLGCVRCPVLVLHGDQDEYGSAAFPEEIARHVCGPAEMHLLEGIGHVPHREDQARVTELVAAFLGKVTTCT